MQMFISTIVNNLCNTKLPNTNKAIAYINHLYLAIFDISVRFSSQLWCFPKEILFLLTVVLKRPVSCKYKRCNVPRLHQCTDKLIRMIGIYLH